jgi:fructokinase
MLRLVKHDDSSAGILAGVEAGGTKFNCVVGTSPQDILDSARISTTTPVQTLGKVNAFFRSCMEKYGRINAMGIASFGPLDLNKHSPTYGFITDTPKLVWADTDVLGSIRGSLPIPVALDTDVNGAAIAEGLYGAAQGLDSFIYVTVGTGIGAGIIMNGQPVNGAAHPEIGHMLVPQNLSIDPFEGICPFHGNCIEGLASGTAMRERWGESAENLPEGHLAWALEVHYLASLCMNLTVSFSPQRIILGGGVLAQSHLFNSIRNEFVRLMAGYGTSALFNDVSAFIVPPQLQSKAGQVGALQLAQNALSNQHANTH